MEQISGGSEKLIIFLMQMDNYSIICIVESSDVTTSAFLSLVFMKK